MNRPASHACLAASTVAIGYALVAFAGPMLADSFADVHPSRDSFREKPPVKRISVEEARARLDALAVGDAESIAHASEIVAAGMAHYWPSPGTSDEALECRFIEHPDLWLRMRWLEWTGGDEAELEQMRRRERSDWRAALAVGVGYCSQQAIVLTGFLRERGVEARTVGLGGHVVTVAQTPEGEWVLDPDYGVVIRRPLAEVAANPRIVREIYGGAGYPEARIVQLTAIYSSGKSGEYGGPKIGQLTDRGEAARHLALWGGLAAAVVGVRLRRGGSAHARDAQREAARHLDSA